MEHLYKIFSIDEWEARKDSDNILGTDKDILDGFIHLSMDRQVDKIVNKIFKDDKDNCILLKIDFNKISNQGKFTLDKASNGDSYYHLYKRSFSKDCVTEVINYSEINEVYKKVNLLNKLIKN